MKHSLILLPVFAFFTGCDSISEPLSSVTQSGEGQYKGKTEEEDLQQMIIDICNNRNCSRIDPREKFSNMTFNIDLYITNNDQINVYKFTNNNVSIGFFQKEMTKPSIKTILVLRDLKELGFDLKYIGGEKWHCGEKPLKRRYCRQEKIQGQGQDFLDYIVADNQMEFSYKDGDTVVPL